MAITATQLKEIRQEFAALKPASVTLEGNRTMSVKEAVLALAPTLERMRKRGFEVQELVERLHEKGIEVKAPTLAKYLSEFRRQKQKKKDTPRTALTKVVPSMPSAYNRESDRCGGGFVQPDIPDEEL